MPLDLEAIRKRCEAATEGPWEVESIPPPSYDDPGWRTVLCGPGPKTVGKPVVAAARDAVLRVWGGTVHRSAIDIKADLRFAAHARTDLPAAIAELTTIRAMLADALAEVGRLRGAAGAYVAALTAVEEGLECTSDDEFRQQAARVEAAWKGLRAALEVKPTADAMQAQIDALAEVQRLQRDNARLHNAGLTLLGIVSELHKSLFYEHTEPQNYTELPEIVEARAALEVKP